jgi:hypothetical protein
MGVQADVQFFQFNAGQAGFVRRLIKGLLPTLVKPAKLRPVGLGGVA